MCIIIQFIFAFLNLNQLETLLKTSSKQFIKFAIVGAISTAIYYGIFLFCFHFLETNKEIAYTIGYFGGLISGYFLNKNWSFRVENSSNIIVAKYFLLYAITYFIGIYFLFFLTNDLKIDTSLAGLIVPCINALINFFGTKFLIFKT